jgi:hypothetical protein
MINYCLMLCLQLIASAVTYHDYLPVKRAEYLCSYCHQLKPVALTAVQA